MFNNSSNPGHYLMTNAWSYPHHQQDNIPFMSDGTGPAGQRQIFIQQDADNVIQSCSCSWCSRPGYDHQVATPTIDHQNPRFPTNPVAPYAIQSPGIGHPTGIATITNGQMMIQPWVRESDRYAPRYEAVGFFQAHSNAAASQDQLDMSVLGGLRRLAEHYFSNPESLVNAVHFEYGPSGRPQVVIMLELTGTL